MCEEYVPIDRAFKTMTAYWDKEDCLDVIKEYIEDNEAFREFINAHLTPDQKFEIWLDVTYPTKTTELVDSKKTQFGIVTIDFIKLCDFLNIEEKTENIPCGMQAAWDLLEYASGQSILDEKDAPVKTLTVDLARIEKKGYYYCAMKKDQRRYFIKLLRDMEVTIDGNKSDT